MSRPGRRWAGTERRAAGRWRAVAFAAAAAVAGVALPADAGPPAVRGTQSVPVRATFEVHQERKNASPAVRGAVHGVRRIEGGTVLYYSLGFPERYGRDVSFHSTKRQTETGDRWAVVGGDWATPELVDPAGRRSYSTLVERENGRCLCSPPNATSDESGKVFVLYDVYPPLPVETRSVNVVVGFNTVASAVPVEDGALTPAVDSGQPVLLGDGWPEVDLASVAAAPDKDRSVFELETRVTDFGNQVTTVETPVEVALELSADVLFALDSAVITDQAQEAIAKAAQTVNDRARAGTISVVGHTDSTGPDTRNDPLSQQRAEAVRAALEPLVTVDGLNFRVEGRGEREPVADNGTDEGRQMNRRVTVSFAPRD